MDETRPVGALVRMALAEAGYPNADVRDDGAVTTRRWDCFGNCTELVPWDLASRAQELALSHLDANPPSEIQ